MVARVLHHVGPAIDRLPAQGRGHRVGAAFDILTMLKSQSSMMTD